MRILLILFIFVTSACSLLKKKEEGKRLDANFLLEEKYQYYQSNDYLVHLAGFGKSFMLNSNVELVSLEAAKVKFLTMMVERIVHANEILLGGMKGEIKFHIVKNKTPFYFSLPDNRIFLSLGLIQKYIKNEAELAGIITYELIRIQKKLYPKIILVPVGAIKAEKLISLLRISVENRIELNKWVYHSLTRAAYDPDVYLSWLQTMNKSSLDFSLHLGDLRTISLEEAQLKAFIVKKTVNRTNKIDKIKKNSSNEFYQVLNGLNKVSI